MGQRVVAINPNRDTSPSDAVDMAYEFAQFLRKTGWEVTDEKFARSLWVERAHSTSPLLTYLVAGFDAGYRLERKPAAEQVSANPPPATIPRHGRLSTSH